MLPNEIKNTLEQLIVIVNRQEAQLKELEKALEQLSAPKKKKS